MRKVAFLLLALCGCFQSEGRGLCGGLSEKINKLIHSPIPDEAISPSHHHLLERIGGEVTLEEQNLMALRKGLSNRTPDLSPEEGGKLIEILKKTRGGEKQLNAIKGLEEIPTLMESHRLLDEGVRHSEARDNYHYLIDYAYIQGFRGEHLRKLGRYFAGLPEVLPEEDGKNFILFVLTLPRSKRLQAVESLPDFVSGNTRNRIFRRYIKMEGELLKKFGEFYERITTEESGRAAQLSPIEATDLAAKEVDNLRKLTLKCLSRVSRGVTQHAKLKHRRFLTWSDSVLGMISLGRNNWHRPFFEWFLQGVLDTVLRAARVNVRTRALMNTEWSDISRISAKYTISRSLAVATSFIMYLFFSSYDALEREGRLNAILSDEEVREEEMERLRDELVIALTKALEEVEESGQGAVLANLHFNDLSPEQLASPEVQGVLREALDLRIYEEQPRGYKVTDNPFTEGVITAWDTLIPEIKTGDQAVDFWIFHSYYALFLAVPEFFFEKEIYRHLCLNVADTRKVQIAAAGVILAKKILLDNFVLLPLRTYEIGL